LSLTKIVKNWSIHELCYSDSSFVYHGEE